jgi:hypothetical protein
MDEFKKHPIWNKVFLASEIGCIPFVLWWVPYSHLPPPGWAVAFIAGAAAAMSVHDDMKGWQKGIWMLIIGAFLITELRAIDKDRNDAEERYKDDRQAQETNFQSIREQQNKDFTATASALEKTIQNTGAEIKMTNQAVAQATNAVNDATGGDSYLVLTLLMPGQVVSLRKVGESPLYDVHLTIESGHSIPKFPQHEMRAFEFRKIDIGNVASGSQQVVTDHAMWVGQIPPQYAYFDVSGTSAYISTEFRARNGTWYETEWIRGIPDPTYPTSPMFMHWVEAVRVYRANPKTGGNDLREHPEELPAGCPLGSLMIRPQR